MSAKDKLYKQRLKELHVKYTPSKYDRAKNKDWRKEWSSFLQYDNHWDWRYIIDVLRYKLELTKLNLMIYSHTTDETTGKMVSEIDEVLQKFDQWLNTDYFKEVYTFSQLHTKSYVVFYRGYDPKTEIGKCYYSRQENDTNDLLFGASGAVTEYCKQHEIDLADKTIHKAYSAEWDNQENYKLYKKMMRDAARKEQKELDKIFLLISKNLRNWWD